jgi:hypothetical protein
VSGRLLLSPVTQWTGTTFSSLMPFRHDDGVWWLRARLTTEIDVAGLPLDAIRSPSGLDGGRVRDRSGSGHRRLPAVGATEAAASARRRRLVRPILHTDPSVRPLPQWLSDLRRAAYRRSREGRDTE